MAAIVPAAIQIDAFGDVDRSELNRLNLRFGMAAAESNMNHICEGSVVHSNFNAVSKIKKSFCVCKYSSAIKMPVRPRNHSEEAGLSSTLPLNT